MPVIGAFGPHVLFDLNVMLGRSVDPVANPSWQNILTWSDNAGTIDILNQDNDGDVIALAKALRGARLSVDSYMTGSRDMIIAGINAYNSAALNSARTLALGRNVCAMVCAWDVIRQAKPTLISGAQEDLFRNFILTKIWNSPKLKDGRTFQEACFERANNWGNHCRATGAAICAYLSMPAESLRLANSFDAWSGNTLSLEYLNLQFEEATYQVAAQPAYGIVPAGLFWDSPTNLQPADGAQPEELRRDECYRSPITCKPWFHFNPPEVSYNYEGLQGSVVHAGILEATGYLTVWDWNNLALKRAYNFNVLTTRKCTASGNDCVDGTQDAGDTTGKLPTGDDRMLGRVLNIKYGLSHPIAGFDRAKNCVGLEWYYGG